MTKSAAPVEVSALSLSHLAAFVGLFVDREVEAILSQKGFGDLRRSHGFLVQHLLRGPHQVGELAQLLGVSQQAVSKTVAELSRAGYVETVPGADARVRRVQLAERGRQAVRVSRLGRRKIERRLRSALGPKRYQAVKDALGQLLEALGGVPAVRGRRVPLDE